MQRDRNLLGSGMSRAMTASQKPAFRAPWRVDNAVVGRGNAGWTTSKVDNPAHAKLLIRASRRKDWKRLFAESSLMFPSTT